MFIQEPVNIDSVCIPTISTEFIKIKNLGKEQYRLDFPEWRLSKILLPERTTC